MESFFASYLQHALAFQTVPMRVEYWSGLSNEKLGFGSATDDRSPPKVIQIRILSPEFFTRLAHYPTILAALTSEGLACDEKTRTVFTSSEKKLVDLFGFEHEAKFSKTKLDRFERVRWYVLGVLRRPPRPLAYGQKLAKSSLAKGRKYSSLDAFVATHCKEAWLYRRAVTRGFLAERLGFGFAVVMDVLDVAVRFVLGSGIWTNAAIIGPSGIHAWAFVKGSWDCGVSIS
jgi:hypothetical protein